MTLQETIARALRESDPEGCDEQWSYHPQAKAFIDAIAARGDCVVPREASEAMLEAFGKMPAGTTSVRDIYAAMIQAGEVV